MVSKLIGILRLKMENSEVTKKVLLIIIGFLTHFVSAQTTFTHADSLRGGYGDSRSWWDLQAYDLNVKFDIASKTISGVNLIRFSSEKNLKNKTLQIDLQSPMVLDSAIFKGQRLFVKDDGSAHFVTIVSSELTNEIQIYFHGSPKVAKLPPWDGGIIWAKDSNGKPWVTIACQNLGASVWFPCKDSQVDEPQNGVTMHFTVPDGLVCVSNGSSTGKSAAEMGWTSYNWVVKNPINNYCMIPYIGDYVNVHRDYKGEKGMLSIDFWTLRANQSKAEKRIGEALRTIEAMEYWFGPYPFYEDGYKLVETPHLGMEHQGAIAYGNGFQNGYKGTDLSGTGIGMKWDFIIVHESGHEWFGNNITSKDIADMWIHESFTNYSESLFTEYFFSKKEGETYCRGLRKNIENDRSIIGAYGVQNEGSSDMYYKGANMLQTIRSVVNNDTLFRSMLRSLNTNFYHQQVTTEQIENYMSQVLKMDLKPVFDQYLRTTKIPVLEMQFGKDFVKYRWTNCVSDFNLPIRTASGVYSASTKWTKQKLIYKKQFDVDLNMYIKIKS